MSRRIWQAHDRFFKLLLEQPEIARALIQERLPPALVKLLADVNPQPLPTEFVGGRLHSVLADKVLRLPLRDAPEVNQLCLLEHKSFPPVDFEYQMLKDYVGVWQHLFQQGLARVSRVTALVVYHGRTPWCRDERFPVGLARSVELPPDRGLEFSYNLFDVGQVEPEDQLSSNPWLRAGLRLLRHGTRSLERQEARSLLLGIFGDLRGSPETLLRGVSQYVLEKWISITRADLEEIVCEVLAAEEQAMVSKAAEEYIALGERKGIKTGIQTGMRKGIRKGKVAGAADIFLEVLESAFGGVPQEFHARVEKASTAQIKVWANRIVGAENIEQVFQEP